MVDERVLTFDDLEVGQEFPPSTYEVTEDAVDKYEEAIGAPEPVCLEMQSAEGATVRKRVAQPTIAGFFTRPTMLLPADLKMPPGSVQAEQRYVFLNAILPGDTMTTTTRVSNKYIKKERKYVEMESTTVNQRGETVLQATLVGIWSR